MRIEELVNKCKEHFDYRSIVDEMQEIIDYGSIVEFVLFEIANGLLNDIGFDLNKLLKE